LSAAAYHQITTALRMTHIIMMIRDRKSETTVVDMIRWSGNKLFRVGSLSRFGWKEKATSLAYKILKYASCSSNWWQN
jgi:hypothetical protein